MDELKDLVKELRDAKGKAQIQALQTINKSLLEEYTIKVGETEIQPLLVEAYYCANNFVDDNSHQRPGQMDHFGCLYFHEKGYGGVDICLSDGDYYFSILLKCSVVDGVICTQTTLFDTLKKYKDAADGGDVRFELVRRTKPVNDPIIYVPRKNLVRETMKYELLGAISLTAVDCKSVRASLQEGKIKTFARYFLQDGIEPSDEKIMEYLGYKSNELKNWYNNEKLRSDYR